VRSSTPGGAYQPWNGTSMAAPHATGTAALLHQAQPGLSITATAFALTSTAVPLVLTVSDTIPNNTYGWGRLDALGAVLRVASAGSLSGMVRTTAGQPIPQATVAALSETSADHALAIADAAGRYALPLTAGPYTVTASAFGYTTSAPARVVVSPGAVTQHDIVLEATPTGVLQGSILEEGTGTPLAATVAISGAGLVAQTDPNTGVYSITLPVGVYTLRASSLGHRVVTREAVIVAAGDTASAFFSLPTGPNVLLVDSGAWYNDSHAAAYQRALDGLGYVHATHAITIADSVPRLADLVPYDVVIWSAPQDSPGLIGADAVIKQYLDQGGRLLISGQDVAYWDGGGSASFYASYFFDYLHARFIADQAGSAGLHAVPLEPFAGITLTLNTADSDRNQSTPDVVAPYDRQSAAVFAYDSSQTAGLRADVCLPYRVLYFSFGLEGAGPAANRQAVLDQSITWLMGSRPQRQLELTSGNQLHIQSAPALVTGTVSLWNTGRLTDTYNLAASDSPWPVTLWDGAFQHQILGEVTAASCQVVTVGVAITIPYDTARDVTDAISLTATSASSPTVSRAVS
ncbi:MAG: carboxypeptidase regulatory-like domain-containing protein, partial [bacterium]|nr:carboxypeptidase regulatory-like domain-containing protein [bacterium]